MMLQTFPLSSPPHPSFPVSRLMNGTLFCTLSAACPASRESDHCCQHLRRGMPISHSLPCLLTSGHTLLGTSRAPRTQTWEIMCRPLWLLRRPIHGLRIWQKQTSTIVSNCEKARALTHTHKHMHIYTYTETLTNHFWQAWG